MFTLAEKVIMLEVLSKEIRLLKKENREFSYKGYSIENIENLRHKITWTKPTDEDQLMSLKF